MSAMCIGRFERFEPLVERRASISIEWTSPSSSRRLSSRRVRKNSTSLAFNPAAFCPGLGMGMTTGGSTGGRTDGRTEGLAATGWCLPFDFAGAAGSGLPFATGTGAAGFARGFTTGFATGFAIGFATTFGTALVGTGLATTFAGALAGAFAGAALVAFAGVALFLDVAFFAAGAGALGLGV